MIDPHIVHRHKCLQGNNNTIDSLTPQFLHILPTTSSPPPPPAVACSSSSPLLLPQHDSASSLASRRSSLTCAAAKTCSRLERRELAVASLVCANSFQTWFSADKLLTLSSRTQFSFPILSISSSFSFSFFSTASWITLSNFLDCLTLCSSNSILTFSVCSSNKQKLIIIIIITLSQNKIA